MSTINNLTKALIALGGNLGDVAATFDRAIAAIGMSKQIEVIERSSMYSTQPVGNHAGDSYLNAAMTVLTSLTPLELLNELHNIETELGRVRETHWGPRIIDLDLILFGDKHIETDHLIVPHPACFYRRFVLDPAVEIAGNLRHPKIGETLIDLRDKLLLRPLPISVCGDEHLLQTIQGNSDERFEFTAIPDRSSAVIFDSTGEIELPQTVSLIQQAEPLSLIEQILIAATDEPQWI